LNWNFGLDVDFFSNAFAAHVRRPTTKRTAAKDTTAKRYNCDRYFYTHTHTCTYIYSGGSDETARAEATTSTA